MANALQAAELGKSIDAYARRDSKTVLITTPGNINAMVVHRNAPGIPSENITAMSRQEHNRAVNLLGLSTDVALK